MVSEPIEFFGPKSMANLTAEQYETLHEMLKIMTTTRQAFESLSEARAKMVANPIGPHQTHLSSPITPMTTSQPPQPPDPPDIRKSREDLTIKAPDPPDFNQSELIPAIQIPNKLSLRYSCEEIHERMENGFCIFCEDLGTPGHYDLKHKRSKLCLVESDSDESFEYEKPGEVTVEEIAYKSVNMIQDGESNSENESRSEVSVSQFQVPLSPLEPSRRCHKESLDVVDERMCNELVCDEDGDFIITLSAKFRETYEEHQFESVENYFSSFEYALTRSPLQHTPTDQYRAPFNPCQNHSGKPHNKSKFGNRIGHEIEFDREGDEIEDDELQDKQIEQTVETLIMNEGEQPLDNTRHNNLFNEMAASLGLVGDENQEDGTKLAREKIVKKNNSETKIMFSSSDHSCFVALITTSNLHKDTLSLPKDFTTSNGVKRECREIVLTDKGNRAWALELRFNQVGNGEILVMFPAEKASKKSFPVEVMHWINQKNEAGYSPNEKISYTLTSGLCQAKRDHEAIRVLEKLIQSEFSLDLLDCSSLTGLFCKPKLEAEVTILLEGNMNIKRTTFFGRNVVKWKCWLVMGSRLPLHYWVAWRKLIVWEEIYLESIEQNLEFAIDRGWVEFWINTHDFTLTNYGLRLSPSEYTKNTFLLVYHLSKHSASCLFLNTSTGCIGALLMVYDAKMLIQLDAPTVFNDLLCKMRIVHGLEDLRQFTRAGLKFHLKHKWRSKFGSNKPTRTWTNYSRYDSSSCALRHEENYVLVLLIIIEALTLFNDQHTLVEKNGTETTSIVLKQIFGRATHQLPLKQSLSQVLLHIQHRDCSFFGYMLVTTSDCFGTLFEIPDKEIAKLHRIFFLRVLIQWKWYPPTQAIRSFTKLSMTSNQILYP